jgi:hypothetical protein
MSPPLRVLLAMVDPVARQLVSGWLTGAGLGVVPVGDAGAIAAALIDHQADAVVVGPEAPAATLHALPAWLPVVQLQSSRELPRRSDARVERVRGAEELIVALRRVTQLAEGSQRGLPAVPRIVAAPSPLPPPPSRAPSPSPAADSAGVPAYVSDHDEPSLVIDVSDLPTTRR